MINIDFSLAGLQQINVALGWGELGIALLSILFLEFFHLVEAGTTLKKRFLASPRALRWAVYYSLALGIVLFGVFNHTQFIYFQF